MQNQLSSKATTIAKLQSDNKVLQAKVDEAQPWFDLTKEQQDNQKKEADAKAAALSKQEADQKAADDKAKADAAAK